MDKDILFACSTENRESHFASALRLVKSLRWLGGTLAGADFLLCAVNGINQYYEALFRDLAVLVKVSPEIYPEDPCANKFKIFDHDEIHRYDTLVLLDRDTIIVQDPSAFFNGKFQARIAEISPIESKILARIGKRFGLRLIEPIRYCQPQVLIFPKDAHPKIIPAWQRYCNLIADDPILSHACGAHVNEASLALAQIKNPVPFSPLPYSMNFHTHDDDLITPDEALNTDPVIVHCQRRIDNLGCVETTPYPFANERIRAFNQRLLQDKTSSGWKLRSLAPPHPEVAVPFIVGSGRSGTNLLRMMLDSHPQVAVLPETHFIPDALNAARQNAQDPGAAFFAAIRQHQRWDDFKLEEAEVKQRILNIKPFEAAAALRAFYETYAQRFNKTRWGDHTPAYAYHVGLIKAVLPEAHFIHLLRDGRDVVLSYSGFWFAARSDGKIGSHWLNRTLQAQRAIDHKHYLQVRYEHLVCDPENTLRRVCEFLKLDWDAAMLRYFERAPERIEDLHRDVHRPNTGELLASADERRRIYENLDRPPDPSRLNRWERELGPWRLYRIERVIGDGLARQGYRPRGLANPGRAIRHLATRIKSACFFPEIAFKLFREKIS